MSSNTVATFTDRLAKPARHSVADDGSWLLSTAREHACFSHPLFARLAETKDKPLTVTQAARLLKNYDAHASHLRRLLLKAAAIMPERAVAFILENVRNEYGNGHEDRRHQLQLQDLAWQCGVSPDDYKAIAVEAGIKQFIKAVTPYYYPLDGKLISNCHSKQAVSAGAITATEILAIEEFKALQKAFASFGQEHHIWFDHVTVECEHTDESISLALYFSQQGHRQSVATGLKGVLDANCHLYDGLLSSIS